MVNRVFICAVATVMLACGVQVCGDTLRVDLHFDSTATSPARTAQASGTIRAMDRIAVPGFCTSLSSGNPALPCRLIYIALPPNTDVSSVKIPQGSYSTAVLPGSYDIAPVPAVAASAREVDYGLGKAIVAGRNAHTYAASEFYPREQLRLVEIGNLRSWKIAVLEFWPYAYNPATGKVRVINTTTASLDYSTVSTLNSTISDPVAVGMSGFVSNKAQAASWYGSESANVSPPGYAIITTNAIASASTALTDFVSFQTARGFAVKVATEGDWGGGTGDAAAEHIRAWLKSNYLALNIEYVLLIGGPNPAYGTVPMKLLWPRNWSSSYKDAASDYYYSDLTGNWDRDADGHPGEEPDDFGTGGIDRIPEVYVGRIPYYGSIATLDSILRKTVRYESTAQGEWARTLLLPMKPMDTDTQSYQLGEQITRDFGWYAGLSPDRVYDDSYGLSLPPEHFPCTYTVVQDEWTRGAGLVFWMTHGSSNTAGDVFSSSRCAYLDDSKPSIVYMASCSNGQPEDSGNLASSVLARGGVSTFSASRISWYYLKETDFTASDSIGGLGYQYARFLLSPAESCGRAAMDARLANPMSIWANHLVYNLYGDPSLVYRLIGSAQEATSVGATGLIPDGTRVRIEGVVLSRTSDDQVSFVQDTNRCAGIRVTGEWDGVGNPQPGIKVAVTGLLGTDKGLRVMTDAQVEPTGGTQAIRPLGMSVRSIRSPKTLGLLVVVWGKVLSASANSFTITGIGRKSPTLSVACVGSVPVPSLGTYVRVVGISTPDGVLVCGSGDITPIGN